MWPVSAAHRRRPVAPPVRRQYPKCRGSCRNRRRIRNRDFSASISEPIHRGRCHVCVSFRRGRWDRAARSNDRSARIRTPAPTRSLRLRADQLGERLDHLVVILANERSQYAPDFSGRRVVNSPIRKIRRQRIRRSNRSLLEYPVSATPISYPDIPSWLEKRIPLRSWSISLMWWCPNSNRFCFH